MKKLTKNALCLASGILTAMSMMNEKMSVLIFVSMIPFLYTVIDTSDEDRHCVFRSVFVFYSVYTAAAFSWITVINSSMYSSQRLTLILIIVLILLISAAHALVMSVFTCVFTVHRKNRAADIIIFAFLFILGEWFHESLYPVMFPWFRLAAAVTPYPVLIQSASLFGSLFISFIVVCINGFAAYALINFKDRKKLFISLLLVAAVIISDAVIGVLNIKLAKGGDSVSAILYQSNLGETDKHQRTKDETFEYYTRFLMSLKNSDAQLAVLPESAVTFDILSDSDCMACLKEIAHEKNITVIIGLYSYTENKKYNSMAALFPDGHMSDVYCKSILVPFGEMIPFEWLIGRPVRNIFDSIGDFAKGDSISVIDTGCGKAGCIICYESLYPSVSRKALSDGASFLVVLSNDSWFSRSCELYQHHTHSILRAVESQKPVLRCSATGVTSIISRFGTVEKKAPCDKEFLLKGTIQTNTSRTMYSYLGDIIIIPGALLFATGIIKKYINVHNK
ncbi:MAG: apolipoprotein N-acyltransferase [Oscillospiraceae bacterium]|nr:apolipoprotein N-acyltransferase [Oscillospiraceae bacterium]